MNNNSTSFCYKNVCVNVKGKASEAINSIILIGVFALAIAAIYKAFR